MKIHILSDGTRWGTRVEDAATGEAIEDWTAVSFDTAVDGTPLATITIAAPKLTLRNIPTPRGVPTLVERLAEPRHAPDCDALRGGFCYCGWDLLVEQLRARLGAE